MSLFDRKTRLDSAHLINNWRIDIGPVSVGSGGVSVGSSWHLSGGNPLKKIEHVADKGIDELAAAHTTWVSGGITDDPEELRQIGSRTAGNLTGGKIGTSDQEVMEAAQRRADLSAAYEGYGAYRGEMEKAKSDATSIEAQTRGDTRLKLASSGILKGSTEWNRRLAEVGTQYDETMSGLDDRWSDYLASEEYGTMVSNYESQWESSYGFEGLTPDEKESIKPSFDEYYSLTRGTAEERTSTRAVLDMRKENLLNSRG